ncbi:SDR family NAD(P)-dependent oxidoreductase [Brevibacillus daliensis]|uniref:SDR family NAD(P)-dependent oxidoreductase n=1 Tax=Brevibacillus daliensis TaxID=2892995 RepID=UPI001E3B6ECF|nr:SDR family NAD(P)-dependent oxidoreductase [Brevibacillus daliensis]
MHALRGQIAVVTGGGSGIGRAIAHRLSSQGAHVWVTDIQEENASRVATEIRQKDEQATAYRLDVSDATAVKRFFENVEEECGRVDILINNAGIAGNPALLVHMRDEEWMQMFNIHVHGSFYCLREAAKLMMKNQYGRVINMSSLAAETSLAGFAHYGAAKYAIVGLTEAAAKELASYQITVNAIKPGVIRSALTQGILSMAEERLSQATPVKRIGDPEDIAKVVSMFVQPDADFVTGSTVVVDGGFSLMNDMDRVMLEALRE